MHLTREQFAFLFEAMMDRPASIAEIEGRYEPDARKAVGWLVCDPEFVRTHPALVPRPIYSDLVPVCANGIEFLVPRADWVYLDAQKGAGWEAHVAEAMRRLLKPGGVFVDVGANVGALTLLGAQLVGPAGSVYAVEASIEVAQILLVNVRRAGLLNTHVIARAASDAVRTETTLIANGTTNRSTRKEPLPEAIRPYYDLLLTDTLDNMLGHIDRLDLMKIDIEGREGSALRGATSTLARLRPTIIAEYHYTTPEPWFVDDLLAMGYRAEVLGVGSTIPMQDHAALRQYGAESGLAYNDLLFTHQAAS